MKHPPLFGRRFALASLLSSFAAIPSRRAALAERTPSSRVVYHLSDAGKVAFVLENIANHFEGMGGPHKVQIALVAHGPPVLSFRADGLNSTIRADTARLHAMGLRLYACVHTLSSMRMTLADLQPGFELAERGGVVKLAELQAAGYAYLRP